MSRTAIRSLDALEILDSRGRPTVAAFLQLADGTSVQALFSEVPRFRSSQFADELGV